ncbi:MAG: hypothetical protein SFV15_04980 [Polyangiaceae bacterium]|nr:hypothetical protein [Polyangiaceae bacterium]
MGFRDERGAMMVIGVFMATFLVGVLYYLIGTAEAVFFREGMQDAADAAALGAAIAHARGMNFIALVNLLMAALVTILLTLKLIETVVIILMGVLTALAATGVLAPGAAPAITALEPVRANVNALHAQAKAIIFPMLQGMSQVSNAVRVSTPAVAELLTIADVVNGRDPADFGFMLPMRMTLPVERDQFSVLCARAGSNLTQLALAPFSEGVFTVVRRTIDSAMRKLAGSLSGYFCGDPGSEPPSVELPVRRAFPLTELGNACVKEAESGTSDGPACAKAKAESEQAEPDSRGECRNQCKPGELFDRYASLAREQCNPEQSSGIESWRWQQVWVTEKLKWSEPDGAWLSDSLVTSDQRVTSGEASPCRALGPDATWNAARHTPEDPTKVLPVCTSELKEPSLFFPKTQIFTRRYQAVTDVFNCLRNVNATYKMKAPERARTSGKENPWKVEDGVELGQEAFQIRTVALGGTGDLRAESGVRIATWVDCSGGKNASKEECQGAGIFAGAADLLGRMSVAQAEYYFEGSVKREEWMWNMNWRARLKRFRLPDTQQKPEKNPSSAEAEQFGGKNAAKSSEESCGRATGSQPGRCQQMTSTLDVLSSVVKH